jgi:hypothetical protein
VKFTLTAAVLSLIARLAGAVSVLVHSARMAIVIVRQARALRRRSTISFRFVMSPISRDSSPEVSSDAEASRFLRPR